VEQKRFFERLHPRQETLLGRALSKQAWPSSFNVHGQWEREAISANTHRSSISLRSTGASFVPTAATLHYMEASVMLNGQPSRTHH